MSAHDEQRDLERIEAALAAGRVTATDPRERELVTLKFHGGLSNAEIANVLGLSESNVGTKLHRTMERLRRACVERP